MLPMTLYDYCSRTWWNFGQVRKILRRVSAKMWTSSWNAVGESWSLQSHAQNRIHNQRSQSNSNNHSSYCPSWCCNCYSRDQIQLLLTVLSTASVFPCQLQPRERIESKTSHENAFVCCLLLQSSHRNMPQCYQKCQAACALWCRQGPRSHPAVDGLQRILVHWHRYVTRWTNSLCFFKTTKSIQNMKCMHNENLTFRWKYYHQQLRTAAVMAAAQEMAMAETLKIQKTWTQIWSCYCYCCYHCYCYSR